MGTTLRDVWAFLGRWRRPAIARGTAGRKTAAAPAKVIELGGRRFVTTGEAMTFAQDIYLMRHVRAAGLHLAGAWSGKDDPLAFGEEVLARVLESGRAVHILAGLLIEEGSAWTEESAEARVAFFGGLTEPTDRATLQGLLAGLLLDFFVSGTASSKTSSPSSFGSSRETVPPAVTPTPSAPPGAR